MIKSGGNLNSIEADFLGFLGFLEVMVDRVVGVAQYGFNTAAGKT